MEYFKSSLKSVLGSQQPTNEHSGAETVERLLERVSSSSLLEDRRDACRAIRAMSRKYRIEVGAKGLTVLRQVLELDRADCEIVGYCLETLCHITSPLVFEEEQEKMQHTSVNIGEQFTEMFINNSDNVSLVLSYLEEYDFRVRWPAVKLLNQLLVNRQKDVQEIVLVSPMGVSKLMDLLGENREVIRNDALLLLTHLTKGNANIQKIVAFENAFDRLFDVIGQEGDLDGGIVVQDCLLLMLNLLKSNTSNQNFFKEGSYIQKIAPMFAISAEAEEAGFSPQKVANLHCLLQLVRTLVSPGNPGQIVASCQKSMRNSGLLEALCHNLMANGAPVDVLSETINTVAEVIRGNLSNQEFFSGVMTPPEQSKPVLIILLMSMINDKQPFMLRCAILYCFECYLYKNEFAQAQIVQTLFPSSSNSSGMTSGSLLCSGLFSGDHLANWFSAVALSHTLTENPAQKEQMLKALIATSAGSAPVSLMHQLSVSLQYSTKIQAKLGILMLLATWMSHCPPAVKVFMNVPGSMAFLTAQTSASEHDDNEELLQGCCAFLMGICLSFNDGTVKSFSRDDLCQLIEKRVGVENYITKLGEVSRHEVYSRAAKQPQIRAEMAADLLLEYEFCRLFKVLEGVIVKNLSSQRDISNGVAELTLTDQEKGVLMQYKDVIRDLDRTLRDTNSSLNALAAERDSLKRQLEELVDRNSRLEDQNTLLRAQLSAGASIHSSPPASPTVNVPQLQSLSAVPSDRLQELEEDNRLKEEELEKLRKNYDDLLVLVEEQDTKLQQFKDRLRELGDTVEDDDSDAAFENEDEVSEGSLLSN